MAVQFEEQTYAKRRPSLHNDDMGFVSRAIINLGLAKTKQGTNVVGVFLIVILIVVSFLAITSAQPTEVPTDFEPHSIIPQ